MRVLILGLIAALVAAGCVSSTLTRPPAKTDQPFNDLASSANDNVINKDGSIELKFVAKSSGSVGGAVVGKDVSSAPIGTFEVDARVGFVELNFTHEDQNAVMVGVMLDEKGRIECSSSPGTPCTVPVPAGTSKVTWGVRDHALTGPATPGTPIEFTVTLHPPSHLTIGDALAGVDRAISFRLSDTGVPGAEDNIGVFPDGTIITSKDTNIMRSKDDGKTWANVMPPTNQRSLDPMLYVDDVRNTLYVDHLYIGCSQLSRSTDEGDTWISQPAACGIPSEDHQKVGSGPGVLPGIPTVYYSYSNVPTGAIMVARSIDGGNTFTSAFVTDPVSGPGTCNDGHVYADELGNVFEPLYLSNDAGMAVGVSHDKGMTWKLVQASAQKGACYDPDPGVWADTAGNVYLAYQRADGVYYVASTDHGESWGKPVKVSPPGLLSFVHVDDVAGDPGKLAVVYRATADSDKGPDHADGWSAWHLYVSYVENATSATPTIRTAVVGAPDDLVQRGPICTGGIGCYGGSRNLLDFIDIAVGPDGRVYVTYSDGCKDPCPTPADSRAKLGLVGIEEAGPRLFEHGAPWAKK